MSVQEIECILAPEKTIELVRFLGGGAEAIYIQECMLIDHTHPTLPAFFSNGDLNPDQLTKMFPVNLWEIVLHVYPPQAEKSPINTYQDFLDSACICCIIYYDCNYLEIYAKDSNYLQCIESKLVDLGAENILLIDEKKIYRQVMFP